LSAHSTIPGIADFWSGALHPLLTPSHVLVFAGLGLYLGQHSPKNVVVAVSAFALTFGLALVATTMGTGGVISQVWLVLVPMFVAALLVTEQPISQTGAAVLFGIAALVVGLDSAVENASVATQIKMALGTWLCGCLVTFNIALYSSRLTSKWQRIGMRIAGSWILAVSILVVAFALKRG
jgi:hypothetical protein